MVFCCCFCVFFTTLHKVKHDIQPDWIASEILDKIKERDNLNKCGRHNEYKVLFKEIAGLVQHSKMSSYKPNIKTGKDDPTIMWKIFKEIVGSSKQIEYGKCFTQVDGSLISDNRELAEIFNEYFVNIAFKFKETIEQCDFKELK